MQAVHMVSRSGQSTRGFTLVEVLVALAIVALLVGILVPALSDVREHARRVVCGSNQRQIGLSLHLYSDHSRGRLPESVFLPNDRDVDARPQDMVIVRLQEAPKASRWDRDLETWDGLGLLFKGNYLPAPNVYYCPSHPGDVRFEAYESQWEDDEGEIVSNYHYRGEGPDGQRNIAMLPGNSALVSDSLRSVEELNHEGGFNVLQSDLAVSWVLDSSGLIADKLARATDDSDDAATTSELWHTLDTGTTSPSGIPGTGDNSK